MYKKSVNFNSIFLRLFVFTMLILETTLLSQADMIHLRDGSIVRAQVVSENESVGGERYYKIQMNNLLVWIRASAVVRVERVDDGMMNPEQAMQQLERLMQEGTARTSVQNEGNASAEEAAMDAPLAVKSIKGWAYLYENIKAVQEGNRTSLQEGQAVPFGQILIVSPNSRVTLAVGDMGEIGLESLTQIRFDKIALSITKTYEIDLLLMKGSFWIHVEEETRNWKRIKVSINSAHAILQEGTLYVDSREKTNAVDITYISGESDLSFWRTTSQGPTAVSVGEKLVVSPATSQLPVEANPDIESLREKIATWNEWQPEEMVVDLSVVIPPFDTFPKYPEMPALHPYRIMIDPAMAFGAETRSLGQILKIYRDALERYRIDTGKYPEPQYGLEALFRSYNVANWKGPYVSIEVPRKDIWGTPLIYSLYTIDDRHYADVYSAGPNGRDERGLGDDIR
ncbi:MAG: type II secretion system protein GspG [bacterium]|jgi:hypothetical protein